MTTPEQRPYRTREATPAEKLQIAIDYHRKWRQEAERTLEQTRREVAELDAQIAALEAELKAELAQSVIPFGRSR